MLYYQIDETSDRPPVVTRDVDKATVSIHDFKTIHEDEERLQLLESRMRTENPDWYLYQEVGASLSDFIGLPNNPDTAKTIEDRVLHTLTRQDSFSEEELTVSVAPISASEVLIDVILDSENLYLRYAFSMDFNIGINNVYVLNQNGEIIEDAGEENPDIYAGINRYDETVEEDN